MDKKQKVLIYHYPAHGYIITYYTRAAGDKNRRRSMSQEWDTCPAASLCLCEQSGRFIQDLAFRSTGVTAVLPMGTKRQELVWRYLERVFSVPSCSRFSLPAGAVLSLGREELLVSWKPRQTYMVLGGCPIGVGAWRSEFGLFRGLRKRDESWQCLVQKTAYHQWSKRPPDQEVCATVWLPSRSRLETQWPNVWRH